MPTLVETLSQSPCPALMAGNLPAIRAGQGTASGLWKTLGIPTSYKSPQYQNTPDMYVSPVYI